MSCMVEGEGASIPLEHFDHWTDSIGQLLNNRDGRRCFREFLSSKDLKESEVTLEFWERCDHLLGNQIERMGFLKEAKNVVKIAEDKVNLDLAGLRVMNDAVKSEREDHIKEVLREAKQSAAELLHDDYQLFRKYLIKQRNLPRH